MKRYVLNESQLVEFERRGILRLDDFVDGESAVTMASGVREVLAERGISRRDRATWPVGQVRKLQAIRGAQVYAPFARRFETAAECLLGQGGWVRINAPGPLVTFPEPGDWQVPRSGWHFDLMHPWLMHAAAPNTSGAPRSMITDTVYAR